MRPRLSCALALVALLSQSARADSRVYVAYVAPDDSLDGRAYADRSACVLGGWYEGGQFKPAPELKDADTSEKYVAALGRVLAAFEPKQELVGLDADGHEVTGVVKETYSGDDLIGAAVITMGVRAKPERFRWPATLLSSESLHAKILRRERVALAPEIAKELERDAKELWRRAKEDGGSLYSGYTLKDPIAEHIESVPGVLTVLYPVNLGADDRGSMFFLYSETERRVIRGEFGHPEWSPESEIRKIVPRLYFRIGDAVYFLGENEGAWESRGRALFDLRSGQVVLDCY